MTDLNCGPDPAAVDIGLGIFLVVGTIAAYIPQVNTYTYTYTCITQIIAIILILFVIIVGAGMNINYNMIV